VPCRVGTEKVVEMLEDILAGGGSGVSGGSGARLRELLPELEETLGETSICGLGQVALNPLTSALRNWGDELEAHLKRAG
jgi:NADH:ubiquinone oxidoreductase subunit F (NADH-binding)